MFTLIDPPVHTGDKTTNKLFLKLLPHPHSHYQSRSFQSSINSAWINNGSQKHLSEWNHNKPKRNPSTLHFLLSSPQISDEFTPKIKAEAIAVQSDHQNQTIRPVNTAGGPDTASDSHIKIHPSVCPSIIHLSVQSSVHFSGQIVNS